MLRWRSIASALLIVLFVFVCMGAAARRPKPKPRPQTETTPASVEIKPLSPAFALTGAGGLPAYLRADRDALLGLEGAHHGELRTADTDFIGKDFVLDLLLKVKEGERTEFVAGIGENGRESNWIINSVALRVQVTGRCELTTAPHQIRQAGRIGGAGDYLLRVEKKGDALTFTLAAEAGGKFTSVVLETVPDLKSATFLTVRNAGLFFSGSIPVAAIALSVDGKLVDPGKPANAAAGAEYDKAPTYALGGQAGLPAWLRAGERVMAESDGLGGGEVRTADRDLLEKDFVFDLLFRFKDESDQSILLVGLGDNRREGGAAWILDSVFSRVHGPGHKGWCTLNFSKGREERSLGSLGKSPGPHLLRIEKQGNALTMAVCADYKGKFEPTFAQTIPDLKRSAPFLTKFNSAIYFEGGDGAFFQAVRFIVAGKPMPTPEPMIAKAAPGDDKWPLIKIGPAGIPSWLRATAQVAASPDGLRGGELRTTAVDLIEKDFTLDLQFQFKDDEQSIFLIGIGDHGRGSFANLVCSRVHGPGHGGYACITLPKNQMQNEPAVGKFGRAAGPHVFRLEKRGATLTMAMCIDYKGKFEPTFSKTIPDLKAVAPFLDRTNSGVFIAGDSATWQAIRLRVDGQAPAMTIAKLTVPAPAKPPVTPVQPRVTPTPPTPPTPPVVARPRPVGPRPPDLAPGSIVATTQPVELPGPQHFIRLAGPKLPTYLQGQRDLKFEGGSLLLKGKHVRTVQGDFIKKDFIFDVVFHFPPGEQSIMVMGLGENGRNGGWIANSVCSRVHGPGHTGWCTLNLSRPGEQEGTVGSFGNSPGPHAFRIQKQGNTLTMALCVNYKDKFEPASSQTVVDLKSAAPFLTDSNSYLFFSEAGMIDQVRLVVKGEPIESQEVPITLPARIVEGQPLKQAVAKAGGAMRFSLIAAPKGTSITPAGELMWSPGRDQLGLHRIKVGIAGKETLVATGEIEVVSAEDAATAKGDLAKIDALYRLPLTSDKYFLTTGLDGKSMLLLDGDSLRLLDADGITVRQTLKLPAKYSIIRERAQYYVALSDEKQSLDLLDKKTLQVRRSVKMDYRSRSDLAIHPTKLISYVCVEKPGQYGVLRPIVIVDEATGDVLEPNGFMGRWILIAPGAKEMYVGSKAVHEFGSQDELAVYDISGDSPRCLRVKDAPGGNGSGIAMSPDGRRVSYLSYTGYPLFTGNIPAFDPANFEKRPVTYPAKANKAGAGQIAYHPLLPIVAAPCEDGAVCFDRESGDVKPGLLQLSSPPLGDVKTGRVFFSADGRNLLLECEANGERFLRRVKMSRPGT